MPEFVAVAEMRTAHEAHLLRTRLEADGITVFLRGEKIASTIGVPNVYSTDWSNPLGGVSVVVPLHQADRAQRILREIQDTPRDEELWRDAGPNWPLQIVRGLFIGSLVWGATMWTFGATDNVIMAALAGVLVLVVLVSFSFKTHRKLKS
jgi:hypothetical protein